MKTTLKTIYTVVYERYSRSITFQAPLLKASKRVQSVPHAELNAVTKSATIPLLIINKLRKDLERCETPKIETTV